MRSGDYRVEHDGDDERLVNGRSEPMYLFRVEVVPEPITRYVLARSARLAEDKAICEFPGTDLGGTAHAHKLPYRIEGLGSAEF